MDESGNQKFDKKKQIIFRKFPGTNEEVMEQIKQGKKFIVIKGDYRVYVPDGYMIIDTKYQNESFKVIVPQNLRYYLANPGEGNVDTALEEIADFYDDLSDFENELLEENSASVQGTEWAVKTRDIYLTYLVNKITKPSKGNVDIPEWNNEILKTLFLDHKYVEDRIKAIAAVCLGKTVEQLKESNLGDILNHITINQKSVTSLTQDELKKITCHCGSHYEIKPNYRNDPDIEYRIDRQGRTGEKITKKKTITVFDANISQLENEINKYIQENSGNIGRHDENLRRMYTNLKYIAKENSEKQLEITPPEKNKEANE